MLTRRKLLVGTGATVVIAAAGASAFALTRTPRRALAAWTPQDFADPRMRALAKAILVPNPHNRQPWSIALGADDDLTLFCDLDRRLPETDPYDRQITIGLGCFLELLDLAAAADGYAAEISLFPDGQPAPRLDGRPIAHIRLTANPAGPTPDPLFAHMHARRSNKEPFDMDRPVPAAALTTLENALHNPDWFAARIDEKAVADLRDLTWRAHMIETETPHTFMESVRLMRIGRREIEANPDGIDLGGTFLEGLKLAGILTRENLADPKSSAFAQGLEIYHRIIHSAMGHVWITAPDNDRKTQIAVGRNWLRLNLAATSIGLALHPLSQALQEFAEMAPLFDELHKKLAADGGRVHMLGRIGYGPAVDPSPRWDVETRLIDL